MSLSKEEKEAQKAAAKAAKELEKAEKAAQKEKAKAEAAEAKALANAKKAEDAVNKQVEKSNKPEEQRPTGKFEKLLHDGKYYLVNVDGRILSSALTEDAVDRMVMNLNNKRR